MTQENSNQDSGLKEWGDVHMEIIAKLHQTKALADILSIDGLNKDVSSETIIGVANVIFDLTIDIEALVYKWESLMVSP